MEVPEYPLPEAAIAQSPREPRDSARLLIAIDPAGPARHGHVRDLAGLVGPGDVVVVNTSRVIAARLRLTKATGGAAEVLLLEQEDATTWTALVRPGRRLPPGTVLLAGAQPMVEVGQRLDGGRRRIRLLAATDEVGTIPLPPYIHQPLDDPERYQTVFADRPGSVAAPTAGLHLTTALLDRCRQAGASVASVDLAVGLGTFRPVEAIVAEDHRMHGERYAVPAATMTACRTARRVLAVGTTTVRALESAAATGELEGRTDLFIHGDHRFALVDVLMTNFHQPRSTLLLLLESFCGPRWRSLYAEALDAGYRFLSFGDAMIVGRSSPRRAGPQPAPPSGAPSRAPADPQRSAPSGAPAGAAGVTVALFSTEAVDGRARAGTVTTSRGSFSTPCFMPVGTRGAVRLLSSADLEGLGAQVVLANTYHLMLRPGAELIAAMGGLHRFEGWAGHLLTDSGGYQVFSLGPRVDDDGVTFRSTYDGSSHRLTPEGAVAIQELLGADIQMALDICPALPSEPAILRSAVERTLGWAARARVTHRRADQSLFGIVQGGTDPDLRAEAAERTVALEFDGYGIGGLSVGEPRAEMLPALAAVTGRLPDDRARYLMGVGDPVSIVEAVALGVDMFDCVLPTRLARHGTALSAAGRYQLKGARHARDDGPIDPDCGCPVCGRWSRAYLRHLFSVGEPTAARLLTLHNLAWLLDLMNQVRRAILAGTLNELRKALGAVWEPQTLR